MSMWELPRPEIKPTPPTLAGRCFTAEPPGKPLPFKKYIFISFIWLPQVLVAAQGIFDLSYGVWDLVPRPGIELEV